ncbi:hypothetical protein IQ235_13895 [Oscillatoriales cyanobacterium LEGE 11467]|uniref:Uncharacterized protein n=1 Tax=Zarconia navalis LEGE 11467 TaxID=1828826 RepID=A0A928Z7X4_9CYAN|nr:hypothetical protein [Zarconia navalis]MBE9041872.1 hypothetical protein [Zarconia navalis LEGE 11467]
MNNFRQFVSIERIESLKAGLLGGFAGTIAFLVTAAIDGLTIARSELPFQWMSDPETLLNLVLAIAIAGASGFLFGVTYRYVIRRDLNPHLNSGAVLAFGLVRGFAQVDATLSGGFEGTASLLAMVVIVLESIVLFAVAGRMLDWAMERDWIKPFDAD